MYNIHLVDYVPEPKPASGEYLVCAHYYAAWKKGAARLHNGFDDLHDYPERTPLMGYYDEENPEVCDWEIKWAVEHGINCFIHCWYRNKANEGKPVTVNDLRCGHGLHEALFNARYQKYMNFAIMYEAQPTWGGTNARDLQENLMPFWMENYFKRENYLKVDGKPVLFIYDTRHQIRDAFSVEGQKAAFDACREYAMKQGFPGMLIALMDRTLDASEQADIYARGYDFRFSYSPPWNGSKEENFPPEAKMIETHKQFLKQQVDADPMRCTMTLSCFRDHQPRWTQAWIEKGYHFSKTGLWYLSPESFRQVVRYCRELAEKLPEGAIGRRIIMIDNWNEWDEGHFVAPSCGYGFQYLQAIREELTRRDNLPDYRLPQELGLGGYNASWEIPDFTGVSRKDWYALR